MLTFQGRHGLPMLRHGLLVHGVALNRGPAHDVEANPDEAALRGPDERGDPYGGPLQCQGDLLHDEVCGFEYRHSAISGLSSWSSRYGQFHPGRRINQRDLLCALM